MKRAKRNLLIAGVLLVIVGTAQARLWGRKADAKAGAEASLSAIVLSAVEIDGSRLLLRTSGAPAYTSYSPSPGVFVVDLTGTTRQSTLAIPPVLPSAISSISADEVVEMGSRLTRVTIRLAEPIAPEVTAADRSVIVTIPAAVAVVNEVPAVVFAPDAPVSPVIAEMAAATPAMLEPVVEETPLPRARTLRRIDATSVAGGTEIRLAADGELNYKAFRLENPPRLVIDLSGVKNSVHNTVSVAGSEMVKGVRAGQFQPDVARVVVDLSQKSEYQIRRNGEVLSVSFGASMASTTPAIETPLPAVHLQAAAPIAVAKSAPAPPRVAAVEETDLAARVPTIAENAPAWKMPETSTRGARSVINAPADQAAPAAAQRPAVREDVFGEAALQATPGVQTLGSRTLSSGPRVFSGEPISLNLKDADIKDVLRTFAELTGLNIAVDPGVNGTVTVDFVEVPWDQALDLILRQNGLTYMIEGNVMRIGTIARIAAETKATRELADEERLNVPLTTLSFKLSYARAEEVQRLLKDIASPRARIIIDARTNQLIISEVPEYLRTMQNLISTIDVPTRQVMIEARIVETSRTFTQQWGVDWGFGGELNPANGTGTGLVFPNRIGYDAGPFQFAAGRQVLQLSLMDVLGVFDLDVTLAAAEAQGFVKVVSAPRVTTQDNQSASITSGVQIPYQTRINFTTTISYLPATLNLQVTPQITEAGTVIMEISVQKNEPAPGLAIAGAAGAPITTRQAQTRLMVRDGGTAVIAGIFQTKENDSQSRIPFIHNIPVIGALFRTHDISTSHDELLIFITPRIVRG